MLFGTADPDSAVYAIDAVTGKLVGGMPSTTRLRARSTSAPA